METDYDHNNRLPDMNEISLGVVKNRKEGKCEVFRDISTQPERGNYNPDRTNGLYEFYDNKKLKENVVHVNTEKDGWRCESENDKEIKWPSKLPLWWCLFQAPLCHTRQNLGHKPLPFGWAQTTRFQDMALSPKF